MSRQIHAYAWDDERPDERPSEFERSTGYGAIHSTQHGRLYGTQHGALSPADSGFTRPSRLPHVMGASSRRETRVESSRC